MKKSERNEAFDALLVLQIQKGDQEGFNLLFQRWNNKLLRHAIRQVKSQAIAKDVLQNSWIAILKGIRTLKEPGHFGPWAMRIVYYKAIDHLRKQKKENAVTQPSIDEDTEDPRLQSILNGLKSLPDKHKQILTLFYLEEMAVAEIAYILNIPPGTVKSRLYHAREYFKKQLKSVRYEQ